MIYYWCRK